MLFTCFVLVTLSSTVVSQSTDQLLTLLKLQLDKNCVRDQIGTDNYENLKVPLINCLLDVTESVRKGSSTKTIDEQIAAVCRIERQKSEKFCETEIMDKLSPCLTDVQKNHLKYTLDSKVAVSDYACQNQDLIKESAKMNKIKCASSEFQELNKKCDAPITKLNELTLDNAYKKESCLLAEEAIKCIAKNLRSCAGEAPYKLTTEMFYVGIKATPCKEFITGSSSVRRITLNVILLAIIGLCCYLQHFLF